MQPCALFPSRSRAVWPNPSIERTFQRPLRALGPPLMSNVRARNRTKPYEHGCIVRPWNSHPAPPAFYLVALAIGIALDYRWPVSFFAGSSDTSSELL